MTGDLKAVRKFSGKWTKELKIIVDSSYIYVGANTFYKS